ncbi:MAG TPA: AraC family transcriptional regulator [Clostridiaceae bacterium]|nr:AraC family transcriptional regulator [Clostridiaceae bacterium]
MGYESTLLTQDIIVEKLVTVHYFEYTSKFYFPGETHDFWEFLYVDKGEVTVHTDDSCHVLKSGDIIFHKPMEFHNVVANGIVAPNLVVVAFECHSPAMAYFEKKILRVSDSEKNLLASIISEALDAFSSPLNDPYLNRLERREGASFGAEQMIKLSLERMLIQFYRKGATDWARVRPTSSIKEQTDLDILNKVIMYLEANINKDVTMKDVCRDNQVSSSFLQKLFRQRKGTGVIEYYHKMKIDMAKRYIREDTYNFTEISELLGYSSIHYFSRYFKKVTGMTPSEYATSVKNRSEISRERLSSLP